MAGHMAFPKEAFNPLISASNVSEVSPLYFRVRSFVDSTVSHRPVRSAPSLASSFLGMADTRRGGGGGGGICRAGHGGRGGRGNGGH